MRQVTSELQTGGLINMIYKIVPTAAGTRPVWNISVNVNVFFYVIMLRLGDKNLGKTMILWGPGVPFLSNFASQMCPGASMWPRSGPK